MVVRLLSLAFLAVLAIGSPAYADPSERTDRNRLYQMIPVAAGGAVYLVLELGLKDEVTPDHCRWCNSNAFDTRARDALLWDSVKLPARLSNLTGYIGNPLLATGGLVLSSASDPDLRVWFDDTIPVFQAGIVTGMVNQTFKIIFARRRPYAVFGGTSTRAANDVDTSFFSGHTALAFAMTTSSGTVASIRGYRSAPFLWGGGLALAFATGYFRVAADAHFITDVIAGGVIGAGIGVAIPLLFHRDVLTDEPAPVPRKAGDRTPIMFSIAGGSF